MSADRPLPSVTDSPNNVPTIANDVVPTAIPQLARHRRAMASTPIATTTPMMASGIAAPENGSYNVAKPSGILAPKWIAEAVQKATTATANRTGPTGDTATLSMP